MSTFNPAYTSSRTYQDSKEKAYRTASNRFSLKKSALRPARRPFDDIDSVRLFQPVSSTNFQKSACPNWIPDRVVPVYRHIRVPYHCFNPFCKLSHRHRPIKVDIHEERAGKRRLFIPRHLNFDRSEANRSFPRYPEAHPKVVSIRKSFNITGSRGSKGSREPLRELESEDNDKTFEESDPSTQVPVILDHDFHQVPYDCPGSITRWKTGSGRRKDWRNQMFLDLQKWHIWRCPKVHQRPDSSSRTQLRSYRDICLFFMYSVSRAVSIPKSLLRSYQYRPDAPDVSSLLGVPGMMKKKEKVDRKDGKNHRFLPTKVTKRLSRINVEDTVLEGVSLFHSLASGDPDILDLDFEKQEEMVNSKEILSECPPTSAYKNRSIQKADQVASGGFTVSYESYVGAVIGGSFLLRGLVQVYPCNKLYDAEDLDTGVGCIAKAYALSGSKGKERDSRLKNLKRNAMKASCIASFDQNGVKWLFFNGASEANCENTSTPDPSSWREVKEYDHHFPSICSCESRPSIPQNAFLNSYATCFKKNPETSQNDAIKKIRARDRQRRRRKEKRLTNAEAKEHHASIGPSTRSVETLNEEGKALATGINTLECRLEGRMEVETDAEMNAGMDAEMVAEKDGRIYGVYSSRGVYGRHYGAHGSRGAYGFNYYLNRFGGSPGLLASAI